jgi:hypothetical protein
MRAPFLPSPSGRGAGGEGLQPPPPRAGIKELAEQYLILLTCRDEKEQVELLSRFVADELPCTALVG